MKEEILILPPEELKRQKGFAKKVRALKNRPQSYHLVTYGCQMNVHDSENLAGMLEAMGMREKDKKEADVVLFNTCAIRENAERKALGNIIWLNQLKKQRPELFVGVCGCMAQQEGMAQKMLKQYSFIDFAFGTGNLYQLPEIMYHTLTGGRCIEIDCPQSTLVEGMPIHRQGGHKAYVNIMYGCNNFCTYCVVPYVRGRERSRKADDIFGQAEGLLKEGVKEITLLGQNVNSYGLDRGEQDFAGLLSGLEKIGVPRIRFMTSHPKDLSHRLIEEFVRNKALCPHMHLPVQSGSNAILQAMNRRYTVETYLEKARLLREARPDIGLTTDIIVAFPGETDKDFNDTLELVKIMRYDSAFTFIYSPRAGTAAEKLPGRIDKEVASERIQKLIDLQEKITQERLQSLVGSVQDVLVDGPSARGKALTGKSGRNISVNFAGDKTFVGTVQEIEITATASNTLRGKMKGR